MSSTETQSSDSEASKELGKHYDHSSDVVAKHPEDFWRQFRSTPYIPFSEELGGFHIVSRYGDVRQVILDQDLFISGEKVAIPPIPGPNLPPIDYDGQMHRDLRWPLNAWLAPGPARDMEPEVRQLATELIEPLLNQDEVDLVESFAGPLPRIVAMRLLGLPDKDREMLRHWVHDIERLRVTDPEQTMKSFGAFLDYLNKDLEVRRQDPKPASADLISTLLAERVDGGRPLTEEEILMFYFNLIMAGLGTTAGALSMSLCYLAEHPDVCRRLRGERELLPLAVEELLRLYSPVPSIGRTVGRDTEISGCPMKAGEKVSLFFGAANRDESEFANAEEFVIDRRPNRHLAFGAGVHRCIGSNVARMVIHVGLDEILNRFGEFEIATPKEAVWEMNGPEVRTLATLPVRRVGVMA